MSKLTNLQNLVKELSVEELCAFRTWLDDYAEDLWDRQIEEDSKVGRLDALGQRALEDLRAGRTTKL